MHISEGVLNPPILSVGAVITIAGTAIGIKKLDTDHIMTVSLLTATFFVASLIHIPVGPGNVHLVLGGLIGVLLGWACFPAILTALLLQAIFFHYGGLVVLGVNTTVMALPAVCCGFLFNKYIQEEGKKRKIAAFFAGLLSPLGSSMLMALALAATDSGFMKTAQLVFAAHIPMVIIEGFITMFTVLFLAKVQPEIFLITKKTGEITK